MDQVVSVDPADPVGQVVLVAPAGQEDAMELVCSAWQ